MITKDEFKNGILSYVDSEIMPHLPTQGKWGLGALIVILSSKYDEIYEQISSINAIRTIGIISDSGLIDSDALLDAVFESASKYGKLKITLPIIGSLTFTDDDILTLKEHIDKCREVKHDGKASDNQRTELQIYGGTQR